jgi:nicotinate-nucleotide adenylyltransferase
VHCAHLEVARAALEQLELDRVVFIPAARSPLKTTATAASDADRIEMLRMATAGEPGFEVDTSEIERGGTSYTIKTVNAYRAKYPDYRLHWFIGADQFELLPQWYRIEEIAAQLTFIVLRRPGYTIEHSAVSGLKYAAIEAPLMPHSSSGIRAMLAEGRLAEDLLPPTVEAFISSRGLYTR